jgi:beta-galactosidase
VVAWEQIKLTDAPPPEAIVSNGQAIKFHDNQRSIVVIAEGVQASIDKDTGSLVSYNVNGQQVLDAPLRPNFAKNPNSNQRAQDIWKKDWDGWVDADNQLEVESVTVTEPNNGVRVDVELNVVSVSDSRLQLGYQFSSDGALEVNMRYQPEQKTIKPLLPRFGMSLAVPAAMNNVRWYGRGPQETYWDRKTGGEIAIFASTVDKMWHPYVRSQDTGNRTDTRWFEIHDGKAAGIRIEARGTPLSFSALPFTLADLDVTTHPYGLPRREINSIFIDSKLQGVGGDNSWGARTHPEYTLPGNEPHELRFVIRPIR